MSTPLVSVVVVTWNGMRVLPSCIDSLARQTFADFEVIVVDNGSDDGTPPYLSTRTDLPLKVVCNDRNLGFAAGNNAGISRSQARYIATLNNDAVVASGWLEELLAVAEHNELAGMFASKILLRKSPRIIDSVGVNLYPDGMSKQRGHLQEDDGRYGTVEEVLLPSACSALYRRQMLDRIGLFDPDFFAYCEDTDLGLRARMAGWQALLVPSAVTYHGYSASTAAYSPRKVYLVQRNHGWVAVKNLPLPYLLRAPIFTMQRGLAQVRDVMKPRKGTLSAAIDRRSILGAAMRGYISMIRALPVMLEKRRLLVKQHRVSPGEVRRWFVRFGLRPEDLCVRSLPDGDAPGGVAEAETVKCP